MPVEWSSGERPRTAAISPSNSSMLTGTGREHRACRDIILNYSQKTRDRRPISARKYRCGYRHPLPEDRVETDKAHRPIQYIPQLGKFVQAEAVQSFPHWSGTRIA